jgi:hypothetical protein
MQPFRWPHGESKLLRFTVSATNSEGITDIAGMAIRFRLRNKLDELLLTKTVGAGITITAALEFEVLLPSAEGIALAPDIYRYDVFRTDAGSESEWVPWSDVQVVKSVNYG